MLANNYLIVVLFLLYIECGYTANVTVIVDWSTNVGVSKTQTTLQVVVNPQLRRGASMHDGAFKALQLLKADYVRFVPWLPYPRLAVAELFPPTGNPLCGSVLNNDNLYLECYEGTISKIEFAAYGTPGGKCGAFTVGTCNAAKTKSIVEAFCLNMTRCLIPATTDVFEDPCYGTVKHLSVQAVCSPSVNKTFWDFSLIDPMMEDLMNATAGHSTIINFSTIPEWMWDTDSPVLFPADPDQVYWSYEQGTELRDSTFQQVGDYYGRLVSWYTNGGFTDEYGVYHSSGHKYPINMWEVLNEVEAEHSMTPQYYTQVYDVIVTSILKIQPSMKFVGMALAGRELSWPQYFLNKSNHQAGIPLDWISYHFYASPGSRNDTEGYQVFFTQADGFFASVQQIEKIRISLSPSTKTTIDELGVILPDDNVLNPAPIPDLYWNAAGAMFAYIFGNLTSIGIDVLGESQLIGYPTQYPSVSLIEYPNGAPNGRFWVLYLLHKHFTLGDKIYNAVSSNTTVVFAAAYSTPAGKRILVVNKTVMKQFISVSGLTSAQLEYVDVTTGNKPPATVSLTSPNFVLNPYGVGVVILPK